MSEIEALAAEVAGVREQAEVNKRLPDKLRERGCDADTLRKAEALAEVSEELASAGEAALARVREEE